MQSAPSAAQHLATGFTSPQRPREEELLNPAMQTQAAKEESAVRKPGGHMPGVQLASLAGRLLLPGDPIASLIDSPKPSPPQQQQQHHQSDSAPAAHKRPVVRLGPGVTQLERSLLACKAGTLCVDAKRNKLFLSGNQRRYFPALDDMVVAVVLEKHSEEYRVDLNGADTATLSALAFEGASKKNKPILQPGACVYARVVRASKSMELEVSCVEPGSSKSWTGGETLFGELKGGNVVTVSLALARSLMAKNAPVLARLGERIAFQSAVGANGRVWLQAEMLRETVVLSEAVKKADFMEYDEWLRFTEKLFAQNA